MASALIIALVFMWVCKCVHSLSMMYVCVKTCRIYTAKHVRSVMRWLYLEIVYSGVYAMHWLYRYVCAHIICVILLRMLPRKYAMCNIIIYSWMTARMPTILCENLALFMILVAYYPYVGLVCYCSYIYTEMEALV